MIKIRYSDFAKILAALYNNVSLKRGNADFYQINPQYKPGFITIQEAEEIYLKSKTEKKKLLPIRGRFFGKEEFAHFDYLKDRRLMISFVKYSELNNVPWSFIDEKTYDGLYGEKEVEKVIKKIKCKIFVKTGISADLDDL